MMNDFTRTLITQHHPVIAQHHYHQIAAQTRHGGFGRTQFRQFRYLNRDELKTLGGYDHILNDNNIVVIGGSRGKTIEKELHIAVMEMELSCEIIKIDLNNVNLITTNNACYGLRFKYEADALTYKLSR